MECTLGFNIWDFWVIFIFCDKVHRIPPSAAVRCSRSDFWEAVGLETSLPFWSSAVARLKARRKDLKNQLPEIITFSEEQLRSSKWASVGPPPLHVNTQIPTETTHTETSLLVFKLFCPFFVRVPAVCTCGTVTLAAPGTCIPLWEQLTFPDLLWLSVRQWTMPPSVSWGRGLRAAQAPIWRRLGLKSKRRPLGKTTRLMAAFWFPLLARLCVVV